MEIIRQLELRLDLKTLMCALGGTRRASRLETDAIWSLAAIEKHAQPKAIVDLFDLCRHSATQVVLKRPNGAENLQLTIGPKTNLLKNARMVQVSVCTLGACLDQLRDQLRQEKKELRAFVLDTAAVLALAQLGKKLNQLAEMAASSRQWGVGRRMAPGSLEGWTMEDQMGLASILPIDKIGISLTRSGMLVPLKSATAVIGMGPNYSSPKVGTVCRWCRHQKGCVVRRTSEMMSFDS